ncbi:transcriptional regulator [Vibrio ishigakensis]|uniref:Transcriptional regulator n=1 Tax=Vibrio ishigakensis TaxID=1481914 RepID=A0A0B8QPS0_9VIBR|nr:transcriptional regulator [Vibrio ishigakensis]
MAEMHAVLERKRNHLYSLRHYANIDISQRKIAYHGRSLFSNMLFCSQSDCVTVLPTAMAMQHQQG